MGDPNGGDPEGVLSLEDYLLFSSREGPEGLTTSAVYFVGASLVSRLTKEVITARQDYKLLVMSESEAAEWEQAGDPVDEWGAEGDAHPYVISAELARDGVVAYMTSFFNSGDGTGINELRDFLTGPIDDDSTY